MTSSLLLLAFLFSQTPDEPAVDDPKLVAEALSLTREQARKYTFTPATGGDAFVLHEEPVLQWSNPAQGAVFGNVFLWTVEDRPAVIGSLYKWFSPFTHESHEFHSLLEKSLSAQRNSRPVWEAEQRGVEWRTVPESSSVAVTPTARLVQLRAIARTFTASKAERDETTYQELRLLPQPIYRYESKTHHVVDGALFAFVQGTDPEVILWVEARPDDGQTAWHYALVRLNGIALRVNCGTEEVWNQPVISWGDIRSHKEPYTVWTSQKAPID